jgi:hypothetical protein
MSSVQKRIKDHISSITEKGAFVSTRTVQHIPPIITFFAILDAAYDGALDKVYQIIEVWLRSCLTYNNDNRPLVSDALRTDES